MADTRVNTKKETDRKCPNCSGTMDFDPATGGLHCPYCDYCEEIKGDLNDFKSAQEQDFYSAETMGNCDWGVEKKTVICKNCGAQSIYDALQIAGECPYCGSNQVMEEKTEETLAPGGVVPFKVTAVQAGQNFIKWLKKKLFCPSPAKKMAKPEAFKGIYLPYWTFDADTDTNYTARYGKTRTYKDSKGNVHTKTDWYRTSGTYREFINDEAVPATGSEDTGILKGLEPFNTEDNVKYKPEYIAGFASERYAVGLKDAWETAKTDISYHIKSEIEKKVRSEHFADQVADVIANTVYTGITYKYLLLPVWISSFMYKSKLYRFMVNGQTGKVAGKTPVSPVRVAIALALAAAVITLAVIVYNETR